MSCKPDDILLLDKEIVSTGGLSWDANLKTTAHSLFVAFGPGSRILCSLSFASSARF